MYFFNVSMPFPYLRVLIILLCVEAFKGICWGTVSDSGSWTQLCQQWLVLLEVYTC